MTTLVTGAGGCVGAWAISELRAQGKPVVGFDLAPDHPRLDLLLGTDAARDVPWEVGDITDFATVQRVLAEHEVARVIHLAALQAPMCKASPPLGAHVNVVGTLNILEAVAQSPRERPLVVYASSVAAAERSHGVAPLTIYGVYKRACEESAFLYWEQEQLPSIGLRPHTVYGVGRDQGLTSAMTTAMLAAAGRVTYTIPFSGRLTMHHASDVARMFIIASENAQERASVVELPGETVGVTKVVSLISEVVPGATIGVDGNELPFQAEVTPPEEGPLSAAAVQLRSLRSGIEETITQFEKLLAAGRLEARS